MIAISVASTATAVALDATMAGEGPVCENIVCIVCVRACVINYNKLQQRISVTMNNSFFAVFLCPIYYHTNHAIYQHLVI